MIVWRGESTNLESNQTQQGAQECLKLKAKRLNNEVLTAPFAEVRVRFYCGGVTALDFLDYFGGMSKC